MLKKISLIASVLAALGLAVAIASPADAAPKKTVHVNKTVTMHRNVTVRRNLSVHRNVGVRRNFAVGHRYGNNVWYGQRRHMWRGRWYAYGNGPCWVNVDGLWFWNVLACP